MSDWSVVVFLFVLSAMTGFNIYLMTMMRGEIDALGRAHDHLYMVVSKLRAERGGW